MGERSTELLNIFVQAAEHAIDGRKLGDSGDDVHLGRTSVIANQPEFANEDRLKGLIELTEQRELLGEILNAREHERKPIITIGSENPDPRLNNFTLVTSEYRLGNVSGVLGVLGPTRMPYEKVAAIVEHASRLMTDLTGTSVNTKDVTLH